MTVDFDDVKAKKNQEPARVPGDGGQPQLPGKFRQLKTDHSRAWFCSRVVITLYYVIKGAEIKH